VRVSGINSAGNAVRLSPHAGRGRIALAIRVRGALRKRGSDGFKHARHVPQHVVIPKSQNPVIVVGEPFVTNYVPRIVRMLPSIDFNDEAAFAANQVDRIKTNRLLSNELKSIQPTRSELIPERSFSFRHCPPQIPSTVRLFLIGRTHADSPPHPARPGRCFASSDMRRPLPARGERLTSPAPP
jgi:hypothetical protein